MAQMNSAYGKEPDASGALLTEARSPKKVSRQTMTEKHKLNE